MRPVIYFIRHGQTDWNAAFRFQGQEDIPLNDLGLDQARRNGEMLASLLDLSVEHDFVSSPLVRARQTMEIIREALGLDNKCYRTDPRLMELHYGDWQGRTLEETRTHYPELHTVRKRDKWNFMPPGGSAESYAMQAVRFSPWLDELVAPTVCVTHGGIIRCVWYKLGGMTGKRAGKLEVPQDRILKVAGDRLDWL